MSSKLGHVGSKTRSLDQILEKPCVHSRGHIFCPILMKLGQNICFDLGRVPTWVMWGQKLGHLVKSYKNLVYALEATFSVQSS